MKSTPFRHNCELSAVENTPQENARVPISSWHDHSQGAIGSDPMPDPNSKTSVLSRTTRMPFRANKRAVIVQQCALDWEIRVRMSGPCEDFIQEGLYQKPVLRTQSQRERLSENVGNETGQIKWGRMNLWRVCNTRTEGNMREESVGVLPRKEHEKTQRDKYKRQVTEARLWEKM